MKKIITCNCCGKEIVVMDDVPKEEFLHIKKQWGYFSGKDGCCQEADICEACFEAWSGKFCIPVRTTEVTELM